MNRMLCTFVLTFVIIYQLFSVLEVQHCKLQKGQDGYTILWKTVEVIRTFTCKNDCTESMHMVTSNKLLLLNEYH